MQPNSFLPSIANFERANFIFYLILCFVAGASFYLYFSSNCDLYLPLCIIFFGILLILLSLDYASYRALIYLLWLLFICGIFYGKFFVINFKKNTQFSHKLYVTGSGKIIAHKKFYNPVNQRFGINAIVEVSALSKLEFKATTQSSTIKKSPKIKAKSSIRKKTTTRQKVKKTSRTKTSKSKTRTTKRKKSTRSLKAKPKVKKISKTFAKKIYKNYVNLHNYQEIDRVYLDFNKNYGNDLWIKSGNQNILAHPPRKISLNLVNPHQPLNINDEIAFDAVLEPISTPDFPESYNLKFDALAKNIDAFGFFINPPLITKANNINNFDAWFNDLRDKIRHKIRDHLNGDQAGIIMALLIGDQNYISSPTLNAIRKSGLAHLLSISGFHLSFASAIFFIVTRGCLVRINFLALRYDIKKISAGLAIIASFFYLKIAGSPIPAQRALIMVWMVSLSLLLDKKFDGKRALFLALLILTLLNPYNLFQVSFLLSFLGVLVIIIYYQDWRKLIFPNATIRADTGFITDLLSKIKLYFCEIIFITTIIQIASLPILMNNFQVFSFSAFGANLLAIPLVSFVILPLGFALLLMMMLRLEVVIFWMLKITLILFIKIIYWFAELKYATIATPLLSNSGLVWSLISLIIFLLAKTKTLRIAMSVVFVITLLSTTRTKPNQLILEKSQKFYAIYYQGNLYFSKKVKMTKQIKSWMKIYGVKNFHILGKLYTSDALKSIERDSQHFFKQQCFKNYCLVTLENKKYLILTRRNKITQICKIIRKYHSDAIINFTKKYALPDCAYSMKQGIVIDNRDFLANKTWILRPNLID